jgi:hypothetical protein
MEELRHSRWIGEPVWTLWTDRNPVLPIIEPTHSLVTILTEKKLKPSHYTPGERLGERRYNPYSFSTSALDGGEWSASHPGRALAPGKGSPVPSAQEAGWAPEPVWTQRLQEKSFASAGDRTSIWSPSP